MSLLENAINSVEVGVEDYATLNNKRNVSAVRNIFAGILLLFKEKLYRLAPEGDKELLIKKDILPVLDGNGQLSFNSKGKKTIDVQEIKERFGSLNISVDWQRVDAVNRIRNELEHYYSKESSDNIREAIAKSFLVIRDFLVEELKEDPTKLFDLDCWNSMLDIEEVYSNEERVCQESFLSLVWKYETLKDAIRYIKCSICRSSLIKFESKFRDDITVKCMSCGESTLASYSYAQCIEDLLADDSYISVKEGGESLYVECPECNKETFIISEKSCVYCDYTLEYLNCGVCNQGLNLDEQDFEGLCSYCKYKLEKIRDE